MSHSLQTCFCPDTCGPNNDVELSMMLQASQSRHIFSSKALIHPFRGQTQEHTACHCIPSLVPSISSPTTISSVPTSSLLPPIRGVQGLPILSPTASSTSLGLAYITAYSASYYRSNRQLGRSKPGFAFLSSQTCPSQWFPSQ